MMQTHRNEKQKNDSIHKKITSSKPCTQPDFSKITDWRCLIPWQSKKFIHLLNSEDLVLKLYLTLDCMVYIIAYDRIFHIGESMK